MYPTRKEKERLDVFVLVFLNGRLSTIKRKQRGLQTKIFKKKHVYFKKKTFSDKLKYPV